MRTLLLVLLLAPSCAALAQNWRQKVDYQIDVRLDDQGRALQCRQRLRYENHAPDTLRRILLHLPLAMPVEVFSVQQNGVAIDFLIHRDPGTLELRLSRPLPPEDADTYTIAWQAKIPAFRDGMGHDGPAGLDYAFSSWYPQVCAYDASGWRQNTPFEQHFAADFGRFQVDITLPKKYTVAASGSLANGDLIGYGYEAPGIVPKPNYGVATVWKFRAEQAKDFAWAADADFKQQALPLGEGRTLRHFHLRPSDSLRLDGLDLAPFAALLRDQGAAELCWVHAFDGPAHCPLFFCYDAEMPTAASAWGWNFVGKTPFSDLFLKKMRYVVGNAAFGKSTRSLAEQYRFRQLPAETALRQFERDSGMDLDWLWQQYAAGKAPVLDYAIESAQNGPEGSTLVLLRQKGEALLPLRLSAQWADGSVTQHSIPLELAYGQPPAEAGLILHEPWAFPEKTYTLKLPRPWASLRTLILDPERLSGDQNWQDNEKKWGIRE
jgi:hypothetical protein